MRNVVRSLVVCAALTGLGTAAQAQQYSGSGSYSTSGGSGSYSGYMPQRKSVDNVGAKDGQFVFALERVTGLHFDRQKLTYTDQATGDEFEDTFKTTNLSLLGVDSASPSQLPRFALDYVIVQGVTLGASVMFVLRSQSLDDSQGARPLDPPSVRPDGTTFLAGGRLGYAFPFDETFGIWPRAGINYAQSTANYDSTDPTTGETTEFELTSRYTDLNLELLAVISPVEHIAIMIGPYLDLGLGGKFIVEANDAEIDRRGANLTSFGLLVHGGGYY